MKTFCLSMTVAVFLVLFTGGIQAQTPQTKLNQPKLMLQLSGKWQANAGKDTIEIWENRTYGKAFTSNLYRVTKGHKIPYNTNHVSYRPKEGKFKGFTLFASGAYTTWIGSFTSPEKLEGIVVQDFNPKSVNGKFTFTFKNPDEFTFINYNPEGVKIMESEFTRVK